jgi:hypothetical protein
VVSGGWMGMGLGGMVSGGGGYYSERYCEKHRRASPSYATIRFGSLRTAPHRAEPEGPGSSFALPAFSTSSFGVLYQPSMQAASPTGH